ncbi:unnamed protein product [Protopolystoma xenopodis]|uniref:Dynein heavy chain linker domain-containing protein n=1 Tax=Protopolystoma xenopodis TaxID=117903 RepID=A0A3S4ZTS1_9PLAT|nr:unnamed protein product [Protopolystoma xenopodis]
MRVDLFIFICRRYDEITNQLSETPPSTEGLVQLQAYLRDVNNSLVYKLKTDVEEAAERVNFLLDCAIMPAEDLKLHSTLFFWPEHVNTVLDIATNRLGGLRDSAEEDLRSRVTQLEQRLSSSADKIEQMKKRELISQEEMAKAKQFLDDFQTEIDAFTDEANRINQEEALLQWELTCFLQLHDLRRLMDPYDKLWRTAYNFDTKNRSWLQSPYHQLNALEIENEISDMFKVIHKLTKTLVDQPGPSKVAQKIKSKLEKFQVFLPIIQVVCNPGIQARHWDQMSDIIGYDIKPRPDTNLITFLEFNLKDSLQQLEEVASAASREHQLETTMLRMKEEWNSMRFELLPYRDTAVYILSAVDDIQVLLDDHIIKAQTMRGSPYIKPFEKDMKIWEDKLVSMNDILDVWLKVQATWLYLEPIFSSEDILAQMPEEGRKFGVVDVLWRELMTESVRNPNCLVATDQRDMLRRLMDAHLLLEEIQKGLNDYLEKKRLYFPRYFY